MIALDHIAVWSNNLYETAIELSRQTGIGVSDGGWFPGLGLGQKIISLGGSVYIEVESIVDHRRIAQGDPMARELERQTSRGACFAGLCLRADSREELDTFARHRGITVSSEIRGGKQSTILAQQRSSREGIPHAPDFWNSWRIGRPNIYLTPSLARHPSVNEVQPGTGEVIGKGVISVELGGSREDLKRWLGEVADPEELGMRIEYNGRAHGLYAVTFDSTSGVQTIRLNPITLPEE